METQNAEVIEISLEKKIETELVRANVTDAVLANLKTKYGGMKLKALDDKESYLELKEAAKECSKIRNVAVKLCKAGRADAIKVQGLWIAKEKEVVGKVEEVEKPLDAEIALFDAEVERKANEVKRLQEEAYMKRTQALTHMGALYSDNTFTLGGFSIEANLVKESSEDVWVKSMLPRFQEEFQKIDAERVERERLQAERDAAIQQEREELARQQAAFKEQQEAFAKQQAEEQRRKETEERERKEAEEKKNREVFKHRSGILSGLDMKFNGSEFYYSGIVIPQANIIAMSETDWTDYVVATTGQIKELKQAAAQREQERIDSERKAAEELAATRERERIAEEQRLAEIKRQQEEARKAEELAKAGDKANWESFIAAVSSILKPTFKSGQYRKIAAIANEKLDEIKSLKPY